jgi:hypothetical protein
MNMLPAVKVSPGFGLASDSTGHALADVVVVAGMLPAGALAAGALAAGALVADTLIDGTAAGVPDIAGEVTAAALGQLLVTIALPGSGVGVTRPTSFLGWVPTNTGIVTEVWPLETDDCA